MLARRRSRRSSASPGIQRRSDGVEVQDIRVPAFHFECSYEQDVPVNRIHRRRCGPWRNRVALDAVNVSISTSAGRGRVGGAPPRPPPTPRDWTPHFSPPSSSPPRYPPPIV